MFDIPVRKASSFSNIDVPEIEFHQAEATSEVNWIYCR
jgi:hypothetical protein